MYPVLFSLGPFTMYTFGVFAFLAFMSASFVIWKRGVENHFVEEDLFDSVVIVTVLGLVGARIFYVLLNLDQFRQNILSVFSLLGNPGLSEIGALVAGFITLSLISRRNRWDFFSIADIFVTGYAIAQAIGWIGAFFSGFGVGKESQFLGVVFVGYTEKRFPLQFLWMICMAIVFLFLWRVEDRYRMFDWYRGKRSSSQTGFLTTCYLISYGILLAILSFLSGEPVYFLGLPFVQMSGIVLLVIGIVGIYQRSGRVFKSDVRSLFSSFGSKADNTDK